MADPITIVVAPNAVKTIVTSPSVPIVVAATPTGVLNGFALNRVDGGEQGGERLRPAARILTQLTGSYKLDFQGNAIGDQNGFPIVEATVNTPGTLKSPAELGSQVVEQAEFDRGGFIEHRVFAVHVNTVAAEVVTFTLAVNDIATATNIILLGVPHAGPAMTFVDVLSFALPSMALDNAAPTEGYVEVILRIYSCGKARQEWIAMANISRAGVLTSTLIGMGELAIDFHFQTGMRRFKLRASVTNVNTVFTVRNHTALIYGRAFVWE